MSFAKIALLVVVPLITATGGWYLGNLTSQRTTDAKYVEIIVDILRESPEKTNPQLREWAIDVFKKSSPIQPVSDEVVEALREGPITGFVIPSVFPHIYGLENIELVAKLDGRSRTISEDGMQVISNNQTIPYPDELRSRGWAIREKEPLRLRYKVNEELHQKFENRWIYLYHKPEHSDVADHISIKVNGVDIHGKLPSDGHSGTKGSVTQYVRSGINLIEIRTSSETEAIVVKGVVVKYFDKDKK